MKFVPFKHSTLSRKTIQQVFETYLDLRGIKWGTEEIYMMSNSYDLFSFIWVVKY